MIKEFDPAIKFNMKVGKIMACLLLNKILANTRLSCVFCSKLYLLSGVDAFVIQEINFVETAAKKGGKLDAIIR